MGLVRHGGVRLAVQWLAILESVRKQRRQAGESVLRLNAQPNRGMGEKLQRPACAPLGFRAWSTESSFPPPST